MTEFLLEGMRRDEPILLIATEAHRKVFVHRLRGKGIDVAKLEATRRLVLLEARGTLDEIMAGEVPDAARFRQLVNGLLTSIARQTKARRLRAYDEMIDLLWRARKPEAALQLEELWNDLPMGQPFSLRCAYVMDSFYQERGTHAVRDPHDRARLLEASAPDRAADPRSLAAELARRMEIERALRDSLRTQHEELEAARRAERAARASQDELQHFLDSAVVPIHCIDKHGVIVWANQAELELLGYTAGEYIGHSIRAFQVDAPPHEDLIDRLMRGEVIHDYEARLRAKDGTIRYALVSSRAHIKNGEFVSTRCFWRDVTERKRAEQERDRLIEDLTRTVRLNEMFASVLAHDLRNPLNAILIAGQMALAHVDNAHGAHTLQRLLKSATRMQRMIEQLLDFSRARTGGGIPLECRPTDIGGIMRDVVEELRLAHPDVTIESHATGDLQGEWDPNRLAQLASNLVGNAVQHGQGHAPIAIRLDGDQATSVTLSIANAGTIRDELLAILFAPFRGANQGNAKSQGLGLGLFISDQIVRAHGGTLGVTSKDGRTEFTVALPRTPALGKAVTSFDARATAPPAPHDKRPVSAASGEALQLLLGGIRDYAIVMLDPAGYVTSWNTGAQLINGYASDEIIGQHRSIFYPREQVRDGRCERELAIAQATGRYEEQGWRLRKDGTPFWATVLLTALRDHAGQLAGFAEVTRDLTAQRLADDTERQGDERFRVMIEGVKEYAIFMLDPDGYVSTWNPGAERIKGYRADEIIGKHFSAFYPEEDLRTGKTEYELEAATRDGRFEDEGWRVRKDGTRFWANVVITALHDASGKLIGFAKVTRDLTERKRHEDNQIQLAQAEEAVRLRDEFLSIASHELKTPLSVLRMQLETLRMRLDTSDPAIATRLDRAHRAGQRLTELVETLLDVSRITTGRLELHAETFDLVALVREIVDRMDEPARAARCTVVCTLDDAIVGTWDRSRVDQLITNLLANAFKYAAGTTVELTLRERGGTAALEVRDHGPGLPAGREMALFGRFERAASMRHYAGLGLGLYVVDQIVQAHGGTTTAANAPGGGAWFRVELPVAPNPVSSRS